MRAAHMKMAKKTTAERLANAKNIIMIEKLIKKIFCCR